MVSFAASGVVVHHHAVSDRRGLGGNAGSDGRDHTGRLMADYKQRRCRCIRNGGVTISAQIASAQSRGLGSRSRFR